MLDGSGDPIRYEEENMDGFDDPIRENKNLASDGSGDPILESMLDGSGDPIRDGEKRKNIIQSVLICDQLQHSNYSGGRASYST
eukprot:6491585-Karenia_brevis.AAC.1